MTNRRIAGIGLGVALAGFIGITALSGQYVPPTGTTPALTPGGGLAITGGKVGLTTACSTGERLEWDGDSWECRINSPKWAANRYYFLPNGISTGTQNNHGVGTLRCTPFEVPNQVTIIRLGAEVTGAGDVGSLVRLGIYTDVDGSPGSLVVDAGTIAGDSVAVQEKTVSTVLASGWYHGCAVIQNVSSVQPTIRTTSSGPIIPTYRTSIPSAGSVVGGLLMNNVTSDLPTTFVVDGTSGIAPARLFAGI